jgi:hypothetical protein
MSGGGRQRLLMTAVLAANKPDVRGDNGGCRDRSIVQSPIDGSEVANFSLAIWAGTGEKADIRPVWGRPPPTTRMSFQLGGPTIL